MACVGIWSESFGTCELDEMTYELCVGGALGLYVWNENYYNKRPLESKGHMPVAGVVGMEGTPDLLDSFNFFNLSAYVVRTAEKFCRRR